jgi:hypothetical protein
MGPVRATLSPGYCQVNRWVYTAVPCVAYSRYEHTSPNQSLQTPSLPLRDHELWHLALLPLLPELPRHRRDVVARGVILTYEAARYWCRKFGQVSANQLRRRCPSPGDTWHLDEVFLIISGARHDLWRAVDQDGNFGPEMIARRWPTDGTSGGRSRLRRLRHQRNSGDYSHSVSL